MLQVGLLQWLNLHVDDSQYKGVWRSGSLEYRALGRRVLKEALIDEPWPWLSEEQLMWRTGLF